MSSSPSPHALVIKSKYLDQRTLFDSEDFFPDVDVITQRGMKLHLHRSILAVASQKLRTLFQSKEHLSKKEGDAWCLDLISILKKENDSTFCSILMKWLGFCYGYDITLEPNEFCAALSALFQLQLTACQAEVQMIIEQHMKEVTKKDIKAGIIIMKDCISYEECHSERASHIDIEIARLLLTLSNMKNQTKIMDNFIKLLPSQYLVDIQYGDPHSEFSKFAIRRMYLEYHKNDISIENRRNILKQCNFTELNSKEMNEVRDLNILTNEQLIDAYHCIVETLEKKIEKKNNKQ